MNATLLTALAKRALIAELETTPKPGLVDLKDNGSHTDMDFALMSRGIDAVCPFFGEMFDGTFGLSLEGKSASDLTRALRQQGLAAEKAMYGATGGINTHKGAIFSFGFVSGALGLLSSEGREFEPNEICGAVKTLAAGIEVELLAFFERQHDLGDESCRILVLRLRNWQSLRSHSIAGRFVCAMPLLKRMLAAKEKNAELKTLGYIMSSIWDSNAYKRGGTEGVLFVRQSGKSLFEDFSEEKAESLNAEFIRRNLSPGGAADTLALTLFLEKITCNRLL